jgi:hypothetical protein
MATKSASPAKRRREAAKFKQFKWDKKATHAQSTIDEWIVRIREKGVSPELADTWRMLSAGNPLLLLRAGVLMEYSSKEKDLLLSAALDEGVAEYVLEMKDVIHFSDSQLNTLNEILWYHNKVPRPPTIHVGVKEAKESARGLTWADLKSDLYDGERKSELDNPCLICGEQELFHEYSACSQCILTSKNNSKFDRGIFYDPMRKPFRKEHYGQLGLLGKYKEIEKLLGCELAKKWVSGKESDILLCECTGDVNCKSIVRGVKNACADGGEVIGRCAMHPEIEYGDFHCPNCAIRIEQVGEMCLHYACVCGAHFCIFCRRIFDGNIYNHVCFDVIENAMNFGKEAYCHSCSSVVKSSVPEPEICPEIIRRREVGEEVSEEEAIQLQSPFRLAHEARWRAEGRIICEQCDLEERE